MSNNSYKTIVKTTGLIGFVQIFQMVFGLIRNKVLAIIVGTQGVGIWGLYKNYIDMATKISLLGLDQSGVRQIAQNAEQKEVVAKTIFILKYSILILSILFTALSFILSEQISEFIFETNKYTTGIKIVSFAILFHGISRGQYAILNGFRYIKELAISQIIGAIAGSLIAILCVYLFNIQGIAWYVLAIPLIAAITTGWFVKKMNIKVLIPTINEAKKELKQLLEIGLAFSIAGIVATIMTLLSRIFLTKYFDIETVGIYQASWTISNIYVGTILTAMGVDLMPRLMKVADNNFQIRKLINEQMELGMLIASIGVVGILIFSPIIMNVLYSSEFIAGTNIIRWQVLGVSLRVLAFPFSYAIMVRGKAIIYITIQAVFWIGEYFLLILFSNMFGFDGLGINYFIGYIAYFLMSLIACKYIYQFKFSALLKKIIGISYAFIGLAFLFSNIFPNAGSIILGIILLLAHAFWINYELKHKMNMNILKFIFEKIKKKK
ncbi:polysaccharide transporter, PST family [Mariniphaga anaerophila]|uniref:Polysaccharide transporter, PST family n=1 Tax=Mariniphaga anaerophila TaxID=1484053 RepID=A0A1M4VLC2_9BACT|nr:O-antigen translocase [Mariniphaga anaerophila]SHE69695.1 polysaccharide transporter, PST family [Mariniphaga anaerophila]